MSRNWLLALVMGTVFLVCATPVCAKALVDFSQVAKKAIPAVVSIQVKYKPQQQADPFAGLHNEFFERFFGGQQIRIEQPAQVLPPQYGQASGFIVSADGKLLTNSHVVRGMDEIKAILQDGREFHAELLGLDPETDVAVLKIDAIDLPFIELGDSSKLEPGQWVLAVGSPLGLSASVSAGVVSAIGRNELAVAEREDFIQTDAAINRGNSGGPLLNVDGKVIGMATAKAVDVYGASGIGFAIPSSILRQVYDEIVENGKVTRGFVGVRLQPITYELSQALKLAKAQGALVTEVDVNSPAAKAGILPGDVITNINHQPVVNAMSARNNIGLAKPGTDLNIEVMRHGESKNLIITTASFPDEKTPVAKESVVNIFGITVGTLTAAQAKEAGVPEAQGVMVTAVETNSVAALAGLKKGAVITEVNRQKVESPEQFNSLVSGMKPGDRVLLLVKQNQVASFLALIVR